MASRQISSTDVITPPRIPGVPDWVNAYSEHWVRLLQRQQQRIDQASALRGNAQLNGVLDAQENPIAHLPDPMAPDHPVTLRYLEANALVKKRGRYQLNGQFDANNQRLENVGVTRNTQDAIPRGNVGAVAVAALDALVAPPKVGDVSLIGTADGHFARQLHTHQGVNLDAAQTITGLKMFSANAAPLQTPTAGTLVHVGNADGVGSRLLLDAYGNFVALTFRRASGTAAAPTAVGSGVTMGAMNAFGYGATGYTTTARASVNMNSAEAWTDTAQGTLVTVRTTPLGSATSAEVLHIDGAGNIGIGVVPGAGKSRLFLGGTPIVTTDWALSAGWGPGATVFSVAGNDNRGAVVVQTSAADTPTANPTLTLTFKDGTWTTVPIAVAIMRHTSTGPAVSVSCTQTATTLVIQYNGTPTATSALTYIFNYLLMG